MLQSGELKERVTSGTYCVIGVEAPVGQRLTHVNLRACEDRATSPQCPWLRCFAAAFRPVRQKEFL